MADKVFVVSDGTGRTAEQALNAALTQFPTASLEIVRHPKVRSGRKIREIVREAQRAGGFIIHTLVTDELRGLVLRKHGNLEAGRSRQDERKPQPDKKWQRSA